MDITVGYERKLRPDSHQYDFETECVSVYLKSSIDESNGEDQTQHIADTVSSLAAVAKIRVLTELGLEIVSDENGVIREVARVAATTVAAFPGTTITQAATPAVPAATYAAPQHLAPAAVGGVLPPVNVLPVAPAPAPAVGIPAPPAGPLPVAPAAVQFAPTTAELLNMYMQKPDDWYDNRNSKTSEWAPDFRHKTLKLPANKNGKVYNAGLNVKDFVDAGLMAAQ